MSCRSSTARRPGADRDVDGQRLPGAGIGEIAPSKGVNQHPDDRTRNRLTGKYSAANGADAWILADGLEALYRTPNEHDPSTSTNLPLAARRIDGDSRLGRRSGER